MGNARLGELRNASERTGSAIRKKDPLEIEQFFARWRSELREQGVEWEGRRAVAELRRKKDSKIYDFLLRKKKFATRWQTEDLFSRIVHEMKAYRQEAGNRLVREYFREVDEFLKKELNRIQQQEVRTSIRELKSLLKDVRKNVEQARKAVGLFKERRKDWHVGVWQHLWPEVRRKNFVSRRIELDTRLQVELCKMFADYLRPEDKGERVSLETIARLILLAYRVGGLTYEDESGTHVHGTGRNLTVRNIRDNLRYAGVEKGSELSRHPDVSY